MRVAINAWFWNQPWVGSGQYINYLVPALLELDETLEVILVSPKPDAVLANLPARNVVFHITPTPFPVQTSNLAKVWFEQITFPRVCRRLQVDLAHVPYFGSPVSTPVPTVVTIHDLIPMVLPEYRGSAQVRLYTWLVATAAAKAAVILADSQATKDDVVRKLKLPSDDVRVVYLAPAPHYRPIDSEDELAVFRAKHNLPDKFVLYFGGYDVRKNVDTIIEAYGLVSSTLGHSHPLVLAGSLPRNPSKLFIDPLKVAQDFGLEAYIITPGWIDEQEKPLLYSAATVFVWPSRYEGFGLPVLEAMACGTPVVTSNAASIPELAGSAAVLVDPTDVERLGDSILHLCREKSLGKELAARGIVQAKKFTWKKTARETVQSYYEAISAGKV